MYERTELWARRGGWKPFRVADTAAKLKSVSNRDRQSRQIDGGALIRASSKGDNGKRSLFTFGGSVNWTEEFTKVKIAFKGLKGSVCEGELFLRARCGNEFETKRERGVLSWRETERREVVYP